MDQERWPNEAALLDALRAGDRAAFAALVDSLHPTLLRLARLYLPEAQAEDVVQDTWLAVLRSVRRFEGRSTLKTWIFRIMLNRIRTVTKREGRSVPFASIGPASDVAPAVAAERLVHSELGRGYWPEAPPRWDLLPESRLLSEETMKVVVQALGTLAPAQREVVVLRDVEGWSGPEVCAALGISSVNQRVLLHRGRVALRAVLEGRFDV